MSIDFRILGNADADNALLVQVDTGQSVERLLFDCGENCLDGIPFAEMLAIDHVLFSHFHMDHICGFDSLFRALFNRNAKSNLIWGPPGTTEVMHHRFRGYLWNLHEGIHAPWRVIEILPDTLQCTRFELTEAFAAAHDEGRRPWQRTILEGAGFTLEAIAMDHHTTSMAYAVREKPRRNIDPARLAGTGLKPGPWLRELKETQSDTLTIDGRVLSAADLRQQLMVASPGDSIAYLTDFLLDDPAMERLSGFLDGCRTLVCESQYHPADIELARRHCHMTSARAATLAARSGAEELFLFHLSDRYQPGVWRDMLAAARRIFPNTHYPPHWNLDVS